jgi:DNA-binding response OmpR family regulator
MSLIAPESGNATILIVEDDPLVRVVLSAAIEDAGFDVTIADSGDDALRQLSCGLRPRAVVTDIEMAGSLDGIGLARWLTEYRAGTGILVVSGRQAPGAGDLPRGVQFLAKPFGLNRLLDAIQAILREPGPTRVTTDLRAIGAKAA